MAAAAVPEKSNPQPIVDKSRCNFNFEFSRTAKKVALAATITIGVLAGVAAALGFFKVSVFTNMPFAAKVATAAVGGALVVGSAAGLLYIRKLENDAAEAALDDTAAVVEDK